MIPVCEPLLGAKEQEYVAEAIRSSWISSTGGFIDRFEDSFASFCGCSHGITTTNGTTALHVALAACDIGPGDEVILPSFTMVSTALAVVYTGATPVLVDSEADTFNIDPARIEEKVTSRTKAILPVHMYGHPCEMDSILAIAKDRGLYVIEDAAEAHGAEINGRRIGGVGHVGCFSFYANKIVTTGEGGMVVTNDDQIADRVRRLKNLSHSPERRFLHTEVGFNYRMTNVQAAIGVAQMERIDELIEMRRNNAALYNAHLANVPGIQGPVERPDAKNVYWIRH